MRSLFTGYLFVLGALELFLIVVAEYVPFILRPHAGILWLSFFLESRPASLVFSVCVALFVLTVATILLRTDRKSVLLGFILIYGVLTGIDLYLPTSVFFLGGSHALPVEAAGMMLGVGLFVDLIPVVLAARLAFRPAMVRI